jgi:PAS domain S-box-containing protein
MTLVTGSLTKADAPSDALSTTMGYLNFGPFCMAVLEQNGDAFYSVKQINSAFDRHVSPIYKLLNSNFLTLVSDKHQSSFLDAISNAKSSTEKKARVRNVEITTLTECSGGLPIKRHFDWVIGITEDDSILLFGDPCSNKDVEQRTKDAELIDFFQNAPIALHWLSGEGIVLWANQTELDVLGYTAEEYIGQPIMKFCPDEEELVLEIFKQLGSGNTIADVPVRFRAKNGKIVDLLIDSNVKYDDYGKFAHTRCFIRDDTKRKIREARAQLLLEETKRSLKMLDNFMSRSLHHMRTPLHILQTSLDLVLENIAKIEQRVSGDPDLIDIVEESTYLLSQAGGHVQKAVEMIDDISILAKIDQGNQLQVSQDLIQLRDLGKSVFESVHMPTNIEVALELTQGGPSFIHSDIPYLKKVLCHLVDHMASSSPSKTSARTITLIISHMTDMCVFTITDKAESDTLEQMSIDSDQTMNNGTLPPIFQRYHQELLPEEMVDLDAAGSLRDKIESGINSSRHNSIGIGLALSYHLVSALGGDLRYSSTPKITSFWFSIPHNNGMLETERITFKRRGKRKSQFIAGDEPQDAFSCSKAKVACDGLTALDIPSVLVVEDVPICAKLLCTILQQFKCSTKWVKNGQEAIDELKQHPDMYSLVFMDLRMPVMDGFTATKIIKNDMRMKTPVIALTGECGGEIENQCKSIGFDAFFSKPTKRDSLLDVIKQHTGFSHEAR